MRHQVVRFGLRQALLYRALDAHESGPELVLGQFADRTHAAVAEVVDVVDLALAVAQFGQGLDASYDVAPVQRALGVRAVKVETAIAVDGVLDEPVWANAALLTQFSSYNPVDGRPAQDSIVSLPLSKPARRLPLVPGSRPILKPLNLFSR